MTAKALIRIAILLIVVHLAAHGLGHFQWDRPANRAFEPAVKAMQLHQGKFMGVTHSMSDYYTGFSLMLFVYYGLSIALLLTLMAATSIHGRLVRGLLFVIGTSYLAAAAIEAIYFFPFAAIISLLTAFVLFVARRKTSVH